MSVNTKGFNVGSPGLSQKTVGKQGGSSHKLKAMGSKVGAVSNPKGIEPRKIGGASVSPSVQGPIQPKVGR